MEWYYLLLEKEWEIPTSFHPSANNPSGDDGGDDDGGGGDDDSCIYCPWAQLRASTSCVISFRPHSNPLTWVPFTGEQTKV